MRELLLKDARLFARVVSVFVCGGGVCCVCVCFFLCLLFVDVLVLLFPRLCVCVLLFVVVVVLCVSWCSKMIAHVSNDDLTI